eukprot:m.113545 g.113545  ORF g.113545 m.113545 type:complete len:63 (-) comp13025_c0_seq1:446-634(-)
MASHTLTSAPLLRRVASAAATLATPTAMGCWLVVALLSAETWVLGIGGVGGAMSSCCDLSLQ